MEIVNYAPKLILKFILAPQVLEKFFCFEELLTNFMLLTCSPEVKSVIVSWKMLNNFW
jgi:hypothetical protein